MATKGDEVLSQFTQTVVEEEVEVRDEDKLRIGIIGTGWIAESHIESYMQMPDVEIVARRRPDSRQGREAFMERYGVESVQLLSRPQGNARQREAGRGQRLHLQHARTPRCTIYALEQGRQRAAGKAHVRHHRRSGGDHACREEERQDPLHRLPAPSGREHADDQEDRGVRRARRDLLHPDRRRPPPRHSRTAPSSRRRPPASARWAISAATRWTWCSTPSAIPSR